MEQTNQPCTNAAEMVAKGFECTPEVLKIRYLLLCIRGAESIMKLIHWMKMFITLHTSPYPLFLELWLA